MSRRVQFSFVILVAILLAVPQLAATAQQRELLVFLIINALIVASYRLLTLTGEWSLGHMVMVGVGAYGSALLAKLAGFPVLVAMPCGALIAAAVAYILSYPLFRMKGFYFLIGSFAAGEVIRLSWRWIGFRDLFGGPKGIKSIPSLGEVDIGSLHLQFWEATTYYYVVLAIVAVSLYLLWRVEQSRIGLTFHALHWQDKLAESVGVDATRYRRLALVIASFFAGLAGAMMGHYISSVNANMFDVGQMVDVLVWIIVGGTATFYGPLLGLVCLTVINELVLRQLGVDTARPLIYGLLLILSILFMPNGLESLVDRLKVHFPGKSSRRQAAVTE